MANPHSPICVGTQVNLIHSRKDQHGPGHAPMIFIGTFTHGYLPCVFVLCRHPLPLGLIWGDAACLYGCVVIPSVTRSTWPWSGSVSSEFWVQPLFWWSCLFPVTRSTWQIVRQRVMWPWSTATFGEAVSYLFTRSTWHIVRQRVKWVWSTATLLVKLSLSCHTKYQTDN